MYPGSLSTLGIQGNSNSADQLQFQTQLLERLHNISPYQPQRSPYNTPSPYSMGPSLLLPPSSRPSVCITSRNSQIIVIKRTKTSTNTAIHSYPSVHDLYYSLIRFNLQNSAQLSPSSMSLRVSQPNSFSSSPVMTHKLDNCSVNLENTEPKTTFIRPLPCSAERSSAHLVQETKGKQDRISLHDEIPPIVLDPPPQGKRSEIMAKQIPAKENPNGQGSNKKSPQSQKNLATILRTPGPPPSRTTSARLPPRNELMSEVQRTTWARHTTK